MIRRLALFVSLECGLLGAATIEGFVRNSNGDVVVGAVVQGSLASRPAPLKTVRTDANGHFSVSSLPPGSYLS
jgi:Carboxypeptidase regulatory-like domain